VECCRAAIERGIGVIGFTEHVDFDPSDPGYGFFDYEACRGAMEKAREVFVGTPTVLFGVEVDYQEWFEDRIREFLSRYNFDYVVGSVHAIAQQPLMSAGYRAGRSGVRAYADYFEAVTKSAASELFDVIGHFGYAARQDPDVNDRSLSDWFRAAAGDALKAIVASGAALEINASGCRHSVRRPYPSVWCLEQYRELGGLRVTIGSDAHGPTEVGLGVEQAVRLAQRIGLETAAPPQRRIGSGRR